MWKDKQRGSLTSCQVISRASISDFLAISEINKIIYLMLRAAASRKTTTMKITVSSASPYTINSFNLLYLTISSSHTIVTLAHTQKLWCTQNISSFHSLGQCYRISSHISRTFKVNLWAQNKGCDSYEELKYAVSRCIANPEYWAKIWGATYMWRYTIILFVIDVYHTMNTIKSNVRNFHAILEIQKLYLFRLASHNDKCS